MECAQRALEKWPVGFVVGRQGEGRIEGGRWEALKELGGAGRVHSCLGADFRLDLVGRPAERTLAVVARVRPGDAQDAA